MAWTTPSTQVTGTLITAAIYNADIINNLLETAPAKVTAKGDVVGGLAANSLARIAVGACGQLFMANPGQSTGLGWSGSAIAISLVSGSIDRVGIRTACPRYDFDTTGCARITRDTFFATASGDVAIGGSKAHITTIGGAGADSYKFLTIYSDTSASCGVIELAASAADANGVTAGILAFVATGNTTEKRVAQLASTASGTTSNARGGALNLSTQADGGNALVSRMYVDSAGLMGIGTATPNSPFDIQAGAVAYATVTKTTASGTYTLAASDSVIFIGPTSGCFTATIPLAGASTVGRRWTIISTLGSASVLGIKTSGTDKLNGTTSGSYGGAQNVGDEFSIYGLTSTGWTMRKGSGITPA